MSVQEGRLSANASDANSTLARQPVGEKPVKESCLLEALVLAVVRLPVVAGALRRNGVIESIEVRPAGSPSPSPGFIPLPPNVNKDRLLIAFLDDVKLASPISGSYCEIGGNLRLIVSCPGIERDWVISGKRIEQMRGFREYRQRLSDKWVLLQKECDGRSVRLVRSSDGSRYFPEGRRRIRGKIYHRLGRWFHCPGLLVTLTYDPKLVSCEEAWLRVGKDRRNFMNRVNIWRVRHGLRRVKGYLCAVEEQEKTLYPHLHLVFPHLKWLAPIAVLTQIWGQAENSVDVKYRDCFSPVSYICKYVTKMGGWSDFGLGAIWSNGTRLYSMSRDYVLPDYADKRVRQWHFARCMNSFQAKRLKLNGFPGSSVSSVIGGDDLVGDERSPGEDSRKYRVPGVKDS